MKDMPARDDSQDTSADNQATQDDPDTPASMPSTNPRTEEEPHQAATATTDASADPEDPATAEANAQKKSGADRAVEVLLAETTDIFVTPDGTPFVRLPVNHHSEVLPLNGTTMKSWLGYRVHQLTGSVPTSAALAAALNVIRGQASTQVRELHNRVAPDAGGNGLWYDLTNSTWEAVHIDSSGWRIVAEPPILFRRYQHQLPQVKPQAGGDFTQLLDFVNVSEEKQLLFLVYVLSCFLPDIAHPIALFTGPKGSAKTTAAVIVRRVVDPSQIETFAYPNAKQEVIQKLGHNWMAIFDNISSVPVWFSDVLCRASTGAGDSKRQLYTDDDDVIYAYRRCVGLTSITSAADMPDLLDRSVTFDLQRINSEQRVAEQDLFARLDAALPGILGAACDALSRAMCIKPTITVKSLPRMADFALWGAALAIALGYTQEDFLTAYAADIKDRNRDVVEAHPVGAAVKAFMMQHQQWEGTATELHDELEGVAEENRIDVESRQWPKAASWLKRRLEEVSTDLQEIGITVTHLRAAGSGERIIRLTSAMDPVQKRSQTPTSDSPKLRILGDDSELLDDAELDIAF